MAERKSLAAKGQQKKAASEVIRPAVRVRGKTSLDLVIKRCAVFLTRQQKMKQQRLADVEIQAEVSARPTGSLMDSKELYGTSEEKVLEEASSEITEQGTAMIGATIEPPLPLLPEMNEVPCADDVEAPQASVVAQENVSEAPSGYLQLANTTSESLPSDINAQGSAGMIAPDVPSNADLMNIVPSPVGLSTGETVAVLEPRDAQSELPSTAPEASVTLAGNLIPVEQPAGHTRRKSLHAKSPATEQPVEQELRVTEPPAPVVQQRIATSRTRDPGATSAVTGNMLPPAPSMLAPEVSVEDGIADSTQDSAVSESARKSWRELCAREAAYFRRDSSESSANEEHVQPRSKGIPLADFIAATAKASTGGERTASRSRSPREDNQIRKTKAILKRRADTDEQQGVVTPHPPQSQQRASSKDSSASDASPVLSKGAERDRSPSSSSSRSGGSANSPSRDQFQASVPIHTPLKSGPRNCLPPCRKSPSCDILPEHASSEQIGKGKTSTAAPVMMSSASKPQEDESESVRAAQLRAEKLRDGLVAAASRFSSPLAVNLRASLSQQSMPSVFEMPSPMPKAKSAMSMEQSSPMPKIAAASPVPQSPSASVRMMLSPSPRNLLSQSPAAPTERSMLESPRDQVAGEKQKMLEKLTSQLQVCLTRLQDKSLAEATREKYQNFATSLKAQVDSISNLRIPSSPAIVKKGGC